MARYKIECCKDCPDRHPGCHGHCERYKKERAEYDETMSAKRHEADIEKGLTSAQFSYCHKTNKHIIYRGKYRRWH